MKKLLALALCALTLVFACAAAMADASITFQMGGEPECMDPTINDYSSGSYALQSLFPWLWFRWIVDRDSGNLVNPFMRVTN